jgi:hypothetical protein
VRLASLDQKLVAGIVGLFLLPGVLAAGILVVLYRWGAFDDAFTLLVTVVVGPPHDGYIVDRPRIGRVWCALARCNRDQLIARNPPTV